MDTRLMDRAVASSDDSVTIVAQQPLVVPKRVSLPALTMERIAMVVSPLTLLVLWQILSNTGVLDVRIFSSPTLVAGLIVHLIADGELLSNVGATLLRMIVGTLLGTIPGLLLGLIMGLFRTPRAFINPLVSAILPLPRIALFPLILLIVGLNEKSNLILIALGPLFQMLIGTMAAVMNVEPIYLKVARSFKVNTTDLYRLVIFPAALPIIYSSIRLSLAISFLGVVAIEFLNANNGLGYMIWHSWQILSLGESMAGLVAAGIIGFAMFLTLDWIEKHTLPWVAN
ncbi:MAG: ABC transporter permease [Chloroflexi bacterium]|nr:ABC transporter permease [Chloroflexota bacterium]